MEEELEAKWYVLHTFSGYEQVAKTNLEVVVKKYNYVYSDTIVADFSEVSILNGINVVYTQIEAQAGKVRI